ncbi:MAG: hypothetical protein COY42_03840 [Armatimonadetes bacterium CG_4_10_14_0_8_um_filter_66_14]|nr:hypothetical protein [Armatimonadota bacterium]NCP33164.1 hypothetical protein [Armatimonadota bacterium]PIZ49482.1 MAG: hypothetical protein COY42_03840 [Armatimonadetes bacterium CG_4_10_14_0_8_um_filter_66_14]PJB73792.1 MAG: hypothetical protein CO096_05100 [Armatimonadetes bacterium CG_4_9_14_3_um_filter_66_14]
MRGVTCPKCGTLNATGRFSCVKCYAPLASPTEQARAEEARAQKRRAARPPSVPLWPGRASLTSVSPYEGCAAVAAVVALAAGLTRVGGNAVWVYFAATALTALGLAYVIRCGSLDLSVGAVVALGGLVGIALADYGAAPALLAALFLGGLVGALNARLVRLKGIPPALATLCTAGVVSALILAYVPDAALVEVLGGYGTLATGRTAGIPIPVLLVLLAVVVGQYALRRLETAGGPAEAGPDTPQAAAAHVFSGAHAAAAGALLAAIEIRPAELLQSAWLLLPFAALCVGGAILAQRRAPLLCAVAGGALVALPTCGVEQSGLPVLTFLVAGVALVAGALLDPWKQHSWSALTGHLKAHGTVAAGSLCCSLVVAGAGWGVVVNALHRVPPQSAMILKAVGAVSVMQAGGTTWTAAAPRTILKGGSRVQTGPESAALVVTSQGSVVKLDPGADLTFEVIDSLEEQSRTTHLQLAAGRVWSLVKKSANEKTKFTLETPTVVAAVRGTAFSMVVSRRQHYVSCADGFVEVKAEGRTVVLKTGTETEVAPEKPPAPPRPMSTAERSGWARERPLLEQPLERKLWDYGKHGGGFLADDFGGPSLSPVLWRLRVDPDGSEVHQRNRHLEIVGDVSGGRLPTYSQGVISQSFTSRTCEAAVDVQVREGQATAVLRLADERGSPEGVGIAVHPTQGIRLEGAGRSGGATVAAKGFQTDYAHLVLRYEPGIGQVTGFCDGDPLGSVEARLGDSLHFELVCEGRRATSPTPAAVWFADFTSDVAVPAGQALRTTVAGLGPRDKPAEQSTLMLLESLGEAAVLTEVSVTYPRVRSIAKTRLFSQGSQEQRMRLSRNTGAWFLEAKGGHPADGDYLFRFVVKGEGQRLTKVMHLRETVRTQGVPPLTEKLDAETLTVRWQLPQGVGSDWIELFEAGTDHSVRMRSQPSSPGAIGVPRATLQGWRSAMAIVFAHMGAPGSEQQVEEWTKACESLRPNLRPGLEAWIEVSSPLGTDELLLRCGQQWKL